MESSFPHAFGRESGGIRMDPPFKHSEVTVLRLTFKGEREVHERFRSALCARSVFVIFVPWS